MLLTKSQLVQIRQLDDDQENNLDRLITPVDEEWAFMNTIAGDMTLEDYVALPESERRKWYINSNPNIQTHRIGFDKNKGEDMYITGFFFEPWHPSILDRIY